MDEKSIAITLNGELMRLPRGTRVSEVVDRLGNHRGIACSVNGHIVPKGLWISTTLDDGAHVEILTASPGG